jgi:hypothetical protein
MGSQTRIATLHVVAAASLAVFASLVTHRHVTDASPMVIDFGQNSGLTRGPSGGMSMSMNFVHALLQNSGFNPQPARRRPAAASAGSNNNGQQQVADVTRRSTKVQTAEGAIMGRREDNGVNKPFLAFRGIPFAQAPVGQLRFQVS